jgi:hypothetical protein
MCIGFDVDQYIYISTHAVYCLLWNSVGAEAYAQPLSHTVTHKFEWLSP